MDFLRMFDPRREPFADLQLLEGASGEAVEGCLTRARVLRARPGETVLEGDSVNSIVYVVLAGALRVDIVASTREGGYAHVGRGECVGELSVLDGARTSATVRAVDECQLLELEGTDVLLLADLSHAVASNLLRLLCGRLRGANRLAREHATLSEALHKRAITDALTGLYNRRWLDETLARMAGRADHGGRHAAFALLLLDIDHFKQVNDRFGHLAGDRVLQAVGEAVRLALRPTDFAARYGGEEIALLLPGVEDEEIGVRIAERMRRAIAGLRVASAEGAQIHITVSLGVAVRLAGEQPAALLGRADAALYHAKETGRDRVVAYTAMPRRDA